MNKLSTAVPVFIMFIILAILLVFMCLPLGQKTINAVNGIMNLCDEDINCQLYRLNGEWQYCYGKLLTPEEFQEDSETIILPSTWEDFGYSLNGYATYRLIIQTNNTNQLLLYIPEISSAYAIWVNGEYVREAGTVSTDSTIGRPLLENVLIPLTAENGNIEFVIQVNNYHFMRSSFNIPLLLGEHSLMMSWFIRTRTIYCAVLGFIFMAAFYHLTLFIFHRREKVYLLFSILCFVCFLRFIMETNGINQFFQFIPMNMFGIKFYMALFFLHSAVIIIFSLFIFAQKFLVKYKYWVTAYVVLGTLLFIYIPQNRIATVIITLTIMPFILFSIIKAIKSTILKENRMTWLYFIALLLYAIFGYVTKFFFNNILFMAGLLTNMFMIMAQSLLLSRNYTKAFEFVEKTNENLENIVFERTQVLQNTNNAMKELIGNISHDLKTPITVMGINLERLSDMSKKLDDDEYRRHVHIAYHKNLDLQRLTQNLFEVSRIETGQNLINPEWISLHGLLSQVQEKYSDFLESEGLFLDIISEGDDVEILADPRKIWSVFDNIIYNAVRHTENGGITVNVEINYNDVSVAVTDTGCGILPEHLPHIFERFYKVSQGRCEGDSGVGLYIAKNVMEGCNGSITSQSEIDVGTSIIITFKRNTE